MLHSPELEDELGDVLDKAMKIAGLREHELAVRSGVEVNRIKDVLDYRYEISARELSALARVLGLNDAGLHALAEQRYPAPETGGLPFCLRVLAMPYGVGVVNAYIVSICGSERAVLVDSGCCPRALERVWPEDVQQIDAHFVTHWDRDHTGGCRETMRRFSLPYCLGPGPADEGRRVLRDGEELEIAGLRIRALSTPGHCCEHFCYRVNRMDRPDTRAVLFTGDLFFCGSIGGGFHDSSSVLRQARRLWRELPGATVVAPGHGPLTTIENEREFNPFSDVG